MRNTLAYRFHQFLLVCIVCITGGEGAIAAVNSNILKPLDSWQIDGQHGVIYVSGSLTENPCSLAMISSNQSVSLGNISRAELNNSTGSRSPVPFQIELLDCLEVHTELKDIQTGNQIWSSTQPGVKVRFIAVAVPSFTDVISVNGAQGLGLRITNSEGQILPIGKNSKPMLIASGQNILTYYVSTVRTSGALIAGSFSALVAFEMLYD
ncbi:MULTISPECIES: fimbrial protein [Providencia]|uniref:fimbrial protein n=1 Tax=Providencia TaxID=586 RepID=UPI0015EC16C7|nr:MULTISPECIES: fimbrial protein [Providencia]QLQ97651.1 type 1 fimbrial protein [Providencia alcalifaciens]